MKLIRNIILSFILMFTMTSCEDWFYIDHIGKPVEFGITTGKSIKTRTAYSGIENGKEILQWSNNDEVTIWMYWDADADGRDCETTTDPVTYKVQYKENRQEKSYGSLVSIGESLRWQPDRNGDECIHEFYSIYPANKTAVSGNMATFNIPSRQEHVDMSLAYMTAHRRIEIDDNGTVELEYYPRVTTLYIVVVNDTEETVGGEIKLTSSGNPIAGNYTVSIPNYLYGESGNEGGKEITNSIKTLNKKGDSDTVAFFIRPRQYASNELSLTFNGKTQALNKDLKPNTKYNIIITVSGKTAPKITEDGVAQLVAAFLRKKGNNGLNEYLDNMYNQNTFNTGIWKDFEDLVDHHFEDVSWEEILKCFGDDANKVLEKLLEKLAKETELDLLQSPDVISDIIASDLKKIFPNLRILKIQLKDKKPLINVAVEDMDYLEELYINHADTVSVKNCDKLNKIEIYDTDANGSIELENLESLTSLTIQKGKNVSVKNCPKLESASISNMEQDVEMEFENVGLTSITLEKGKHYSFKNCLNLSSIYFNNMGSNFEGVEFDNCGLTSFSFGSANAPDAVFKFKNMSELTSIYVEKAREVIASNCAKLITVKYSTNYGTKPTVSVDRATCPNYKGENYN